MLPTIAIGALNTNLFHSFYNPLKFICHYYSSFKYEDREMERLKACSSTQKETANGEGRAYSRQPGSYVPTLNHCAGYIGSPLPRKRCVICILSV